MTDVKHRPAPASCCSPGRPNGVPSTSPTTTPPAAHASAGKAALVSQLAATAASQLSMIGFSAAEFRMGSEDPQAYPDDGEGPVRPARVEAFAISPTTVTVAEFARFVQATGHRTDAERHGDSLVFQGLLTPELREAAPAPEPSTPWWRQIPGAAWFAPEGPGSHRPGARGSSGDAGVPARRPGVRGLGRRPAAQRDRMGVCRPRRTRPAALPLGRGSRSGRHAPDEHLPRRVPRRGARADGDPPGGVLRGPTGTGSTTPPATSGNGPPRRSPGGSRRPGGLCEGLSRVRVWAAGC